MMEFSGKGILLDIEGTTSSVSFVYDVMFPYARKHFGDFLEKNWDGPKVKNACELIAKEMRSISFAAWKGSSSEEETRQRILSELFRLMDGDVKSTGLKEFQGLVWKEGFESGQMQAHVYEDLIPALETWTKAGLDIRIYSSGSVTAQKLFFGHTEKGNLLSYFQGHYDTKTGPKKESASYQAIAKDMNLTSGEILFCSDVVAELDAAKSAGFQTALMIRPGNAPVTENHGHPVLSSFAEIRLAD